MTTVLELPPASRSAMSSTIAHTPEGQALSWHPTLDGPLLIVGKEGSGWRSVALNLSRAWTSRQGLCLTALLTSAGGEMDGRSSHLDAIATAAHYGPPPEL